MVYSTFMAAVFGMLFAYLNIENTWLSIIQCILYLVMMAIRQYFENKMNDRIKRLEEEIKKEQ